MFKCAKSSVKFRNLDRDRQSQKHNLGEGKKTLYNATNRHDMCHTLSGRLFTPSSPSDNIIDSIAICLRTALPRYQYGM